MDVDARVWEGSYLDEALALASAGEDDEARAMMQAVLRSAARDRDGRLTELAFLLKDRPVLRRLAEHDGVAVERLAELLIADVGVDAAEAEIRGLTVPRFTGSPLLGFARALARSGHLERAFAIAREAAESADYGLARRGDELFADIYTMLGDTGALQERYETRRSLAAGGALAKLWWERGDREGVRRLALQQVQEAQDLLVAPAVEAGDHRTLLDLYYLGSRSAGRALIPLLDRLGDRDLLTAFARARVGHQRYEHHAARRQSDGRDSLALGGVLLRHGLETDALVVLRDAVPLFVHDREERQRLLQLTDAAEMYRRLEATTWVLHGSPPAEVLQWVAIAIGSGVLGNAAYSALTAATAELWRRASRSRSDETAPSAAPARTRGWRRAPAETKSVAGPAPATRPHTAREAFDAACLAIHEHCTAIDVPVPNFATMSCEYHTGSGRWVFVFREPAGQRRRFQTAVRPPRDDGRTVVMMSSPNWRG